METKTFIAIMLAAMLAMLAFAGCQIPQGPGSQQGIDFVEIETADDSMATAEQVRDTAMSNNGFALDAYAMLKETEGNLFFSPYSISTALAMAYEGARGKTAGQIADVFYFEEDDMARRSSFASIFNTLNKKSGKYRLHTANAMWAQEGYPFLQDYTQTVQSYYGGEMYNVDFIYKTEDSRQLINGWVEERTNNKIQNLLPKGTVSRLTRLVLTNAIYFKGDWVKKFDRKETSSMPFRVSADETVQVQMMRRTDRDAKFNYAETEELQILEMLYDGANLSMLILLPKENNLEGVEQNLTAENLEKWKSMMNERRIDVFIPKFRFTKEFSLSSALREMGMPLAFEPGKADFSGIDGTKELFIHNVVHKAFVDVNEEGTEAAAATGVVVGITALMEQFRADHPFIFIIQEKETGSILFMGKIVNPVYE